MLSVIHARLTQGRSCIPGGQCPVAGKIPSVQVLRQQHHTGHVHGISCRVVEGVNQQRLLHWPLCQNASDSIIDSLVDLQQGVTESRIGRVEWMLLAEVPEHMVCRVTFRIDHQVQIPVITSHQIKSDVRTPLDGREQLVLECQHRLPIVNAGKDIGSLLFATPEILHAYVVFQLGVPSVFLLNLRHHPDRKRCLI